MLVPGAREHLDGPLPVAERAFIDEKPFAPIGSSVVEAPEVEADDAQSRGAPPCAGGFEAPAEEGVELR